MLRGRDAKGQTQPLWAKTQLSDPHPPKLGFPSGVVAWDKHFKPFIPDNQNQCTRKYQPALYRVRGWVYCLDTAVVQRKGWV